jgi:AcrR family transcriptional regulator
VPRAGLSRAQVVDAAARIADADGLEQLTLARVAAELGVRAPSLYNHVESRERLLQELSVRGLRELGQALTQAAVGRSRDDALLALSVAHRRYASQHPGLYAATIRAADPDDSERIEAAQAAVGAVFAVLAGYGLEGDDVVHAARAFRSAVHGFSSLEAAGGFGMSADRDASFQQVVATLAVGMAAGAR